MPAETTASTAPATPPPAAKKLAVAKHAATAGHLQFSDIGMDMVVLKDGTARAVLEVTPLCLAGYTEAEQKAIARRYAAFLNRLDAPIQVLLKSRLLDVQGYLEDLKHREETEPRSFFRAQLKDYRELIEKYLPYSGYGTIRRSAYIVIPFELPSAPPPPDPLSGFLAMLSSGKVLREAKQRAERQQKLHEGLNAIVERVMADVAAIGVTVRRLSTLELIRLFAECFHPQTHDAEHAALFAQFAPEGAEPRTAQTREVEPAATPAATP